MRFPAAAASLIACCSLLQVSGQPEIHAVTGAQVGYVSLRGTVPSRDYHSTGSAISMDLWGWGTHVGGSLKMGTGDFTIETALAYYHQWLAGPSRSSSSYHGVNHFYKTTKRGEVRMELDHVELPVFVHVKIRTGLDLLAGFAPWWFLDASFEDIGVTEISGANFLGDEFHSLVPYENHSDGAASYSEFGVSGCGGISATLHKHFSLSATYRRSITPMHSAGEPYRGSLGILRLGIGYVFHESQR